MRSSRNRTIQVLDDDISRLQSKIAISGERFNRTICGDVFVLGSSIPSSCVDLLFLDPPYNLTKDFGKISFSKSSPEVYENYLRSVIDSIRHTLKPTASIYVCCDWYSSSSVFNVAREFFEVRNRITWKRDKGRGSNANWKNNIEDVYFCTNSKDYTFNVGAVKIRKKVIAPYKQDGVPKDWSKEKDGAFRLTHHSNLWDDLTVPFWSMPENTEHPTQKPEKLLAKIVLASSNQGDLVLDPFLGSGTTSVVAKKLGRRFLGIEIDPKFCLLAEKRLEMAEANKDIQGYQNGYFLERNA